MNDYSIALDPETGLCCTLYLFTKVQNCNQVRRKVMSGELSCCVIKAALVVDPFQVIVAANKAVINAKRNQLTTKTLYTELLFCLSVSKNISRSLQEFGIHDNDKDILVAVIHKVGDTEQSSKKFEDNIKGEKVSVLRLSELTNLELVKKAYKIENNELNVSTLTNSIVSRISCKDFALLK